jgi:hypothetical protein
MQPERLNVYEAAPAAMRAVRQIEAYPAMRSGKEPDRTHKVDVPMTRNGTPISKDEWKRIDSAAPSLKNATMYALTWMYDWGNRAAWVAAALSVPFFLFVAVYTAPAARLISQQQEREAIERENIAFCEKHGMPVGTREYALCAEDLIDIRAKQDQRTAEDMGRAF